MNELNSNPNNLSRPSINFNDEQLSSFILQPCLDNVYHHREETSQYQLKAPLLISKIYEEQFFDHVNSDKQKFFFFLFLFLVSYKLLW